MTREEHLKAANFRIERFNDEFHIYVEDKTIGYWYIVASHIKTFERATQLCQQYLNQQENETQL